MAEKEKRQERGGDNNEKHNGGVTPPAEGTTQQDPDYDLSITAALGPDELAALVDYDEEEQLDPQLVHDAITNGNIQAQPLTQGAQLVADNMPLDIAIGDDDDKKADEALDQGAGEDEVSASPELSDDDQLGNENNGDSHNGARGTYKDKNKFVTDAVTGAYYFKGQPRYKDHTARTCRAYVKVVSDELVKLRSKMGTSTVDVDTYQRACDEFEQLNLIGARKIKAYWYNTLLNVCQIYKSEYHNLFPSHFDARKRIYKRYIMDVNDWDITLGDRLKPEHYAPAMEPSFVYNVSVYISEILRSKALKSVSGRRSSRVMNANVNEPVSGDSGDDDDSDYEDDEPPRKRRKRNPLRTITSDSLMGTANMRGARDRRPVTRQAAINFSDESSEESGETVVRRRQGGNIKVKLGRYQDTRGGTTTVHAKAQQPPKRRKNIGVKSVADASGRAHPAKTHRNGNNNNSKNTLKSNEKRLPFSQSKRKKKNNEKLLKIPKFTTLHHTRGHSGSNKKTSNTSTSNTVHGAHYPRLNKSIKTRTRKRRKHTTAKNVAPIHHNGGAGDPPQQAPSGWDSGEVNGVGNGGVRLGYGTGAAAPVGGRSAIRHRRRDAANDSIAQDMADDEQRPRRERQYRSRTTVCTPVCCWFGFVVFCL